MSPARGARKRGRDRAAARKASLAVWRRGESPLPLRKTTDHGAVVHLRDRDVQAADRERWIEPFLAANRPLFEKLHLQPEARPTREGVVLELRPGDRIGAVPYLSPSTRKVAGGILIESRFGWPSVGQVLTDVHYRVEPQVGGAPLVPGSAREVPPWILAGPVLSRVSALIGQLSRSFVSATELRQSPRGRVDWNDYIRRSIPSGAWQTFRCTFPELTDDPWLLATLRWTLRRVAADLEPSADAGVARLLLEQARLLLQRLGSGPTMRPSPTELARAFEGTFGGELFRAALEAVGWVRDERGLGGARTLDGLSWSLATDQLWEAWVESVFAHLARTLGARLESAREGGTRRPLAWHRPIQSMRYLAPDLALHFGDRTIWVDAKYKAHMIEIGRKGWGEVSEAIRESHRADLHQALAYTALSDAPNVDTWLVYPIRDRASGQSPVELSTAVVASGTRTIRLVLAGLPFGFRTRVERQTVLDALQRELKPSVA